MSATMNPQRILFARDLADPHFSLSVPAAAKGVIRDLLVEVERLEKLELRVTFLESKADAVRRDLPLEDRIQALEENQS